jgi:hypothetical protein
MNTMNLVIQFNCVAQASPPAGCGGVAPPDKDGPWVAGVDAAPCAGGPECVPLGMAEPYQASFDWPAEREPGKSVSPNMRDGGAFPHYLRIGH